MKKIILFLVIFVFFGCVSNETQRKRRVFGNQGLVVVSEGGIILEKTWDTTVISPGLGRHIQVPKFVLICEGDTVVWTEVPGKIYDRYNPGDTIKVL